MTSDEYVRSRNLPSLGKGTPSVLTSFVHGPKPSLSMDSIDILCSCEVIGRNMYRVTYQDGKNLQFT